MISLAEFSDEHYNLKEVQVQALGNWDRAMAPPSILQFILVLLMRQAASFVTAKLSKSVHLGTKNIVRQVNYCLRYYFRSPRRSLPRAVRLVRFRVGKV